MNIIGFIEQLKKDNLDGLEHNYSAESLNKMLAVLGAFQPGDAEKLDQLKNWQWDELKIADFQELINRLAEAAHIMEADDHA
jgi:hypothetical protein